MSKTSPVKSRGKSKKLSPTLTVAIIVASIGCLGTILAAFITGAFAFISSNGIPDFSPFENTQSADWEGVVSIEHFSPCPTLFLPDSLFSGQNRESWIQENAAQYYSGNQLMYAPNISQPSPNNNMEIFLTITSIVETEDWVRLSREASITVNRLENAPEDATLIESSECGGGEFFRYFSPVPLRADFDKYESETSTNEFDYFTLQPGEPEVFVFSFTCEAPGIYHVDMNLPYTYQNSDAKIVFMGINGIICPEDATYFNAGIIPGVDETVILDVSTYSWNGSEYERTDP